MDTNQDILINVRLQIAKKSLELNKQLNPELRALKMRAAELTAQVNKSKRPFAGFALSIMFLGQQMKQIFTSIATAGLSTFNDVAHSVEGNITSLDLLNAEWTYLKFNIGEALMPLIDWLIPIVSSIADWVQEHQALTAAIVAGGLALGTVLMVAGALKLAFDGIAGALTFMAPLFAGIQTSIAAVAAEAGWGFVLTTLGLWALAAVAVIAAWETNFAAFQEFIKGIFGGIWVTIKTVWEGLVTIFKGVWNIIKGIFTGDFSLLLDGIIKVFQGAIKIIVALFLGLGAAIYNILAFSWNSVVALFVGGLKIILSIIQTAVDAFNKISPVAISTKGLASAQKDLSSLKTSASLSYLSGEQIQSGISNVTDNRIFNITIDRSTDQSIVDQILNQMKSRA